MSKRKKKYIYAQNTVALGDDQHNRMYVSPIPPSIAGETSISGDMPEPESDDDTLANVQFMGQQLNEDIQHPKELDIGRDLNDAEQYLRTH